MTFYQHIAGEFDSETKLQICIMCGALLLDSSERRATLCWKPGVFVIADKFGRIGCYIETTDTVVQCHDLRIIS